ncbi:MAG: exodeoxyribonuclease VII large subunit [Planctomycetota bacterium]
MDWNAELARIVLDFTYDEMLIAEVRSITGRQWHRDHKFWSLPIESAGEAARILMPLGFEASEQLEKLLTGEVEGLAGLAGSESSESSSVDVSQEQGWTVSQLNETVREALQNSLPRSLWLVGEVLEFDRNQHRDNIFFRLAEKQEDDDKPQASVTAILWNRDRQKILKRFEETGSGLEDGLQIRVKVRVDLYVANGSYQVVVEDVDPAYTLGEIARRRERILTEVRNKGLAEKNLALPWPQVPLRVGVITSPGSDAWKDLIHELQSSGFSFDVTLHGVHVQGERTEKEVLAALAYFEKHAAQHDVVLLVRGGGSRTDLLSFDTLPLALAVAQHPLKIVIGIGHQADRSVLDEIAHSEKTPTAVGQALIERVAESWQSVRDHVGRIMLEAGRSLLRWSSELAWLRREVSQSGERIMGAQKRSLQVRGSALRSAAMGHVGESRGRLAGQQDRLLSAGQRSLRTQKVQLGRLRKALMDAGGQGVARERERCNARAGQLRAADPARILARGFAWVRGEKGQTIRSVADVKNDEILAVRLSDGVIDARVERKKNSTRE